MMETCPHYAATIGTPVRFVVGHLMRLAGDAAGEEPIMCASDFVQEHDGAVQLRERKTPRKGIAFRSGRS